MNPLWRRLDYVKNFETSNKKLDDEIKELLLYTVFPYLHECASSQCKLLIEYLFWILSMTERQRS